ncbi:ABC transporter substrate-binding protein [Ferrovibrio sp.]|uniref:ABC transporter substrate-binding protein n=1 Tax=Ferrovibrio sp. TaxID=1917215 RepID=UPI00260D9F93|nr:ABC transporter substrate-binding protein [Ferrovibrio sp.]
MKTKGKLTRRSLLVAGSAGLSALAMPAIIRAQTKRKIVVRDLGIGSSFMDAYGRPFTEATGIEVQPVTGANDPFGQIKQMVQTRTYTWDMSIVSRQIANQLAADGAGYLEPLNIDAAPGWKALPDMFRSPVYAGNDVVATVLGYRTDTVKTPPKSWADFFDTKKIPGRRAMRRSPVDTLEQALLADGVSGDKLFPLDFDRGFRKLDAVRKDIGVWWTSGAQSTQLLQSGEVDMCPTWNGRAQAAIKSGAPVAIMWNQSLWQSEGWVILKGGPNADLCREFIKFALAPERQAVFAAATGYGPTIPDAVSKMDPAVAKTLPTHPDNRAGAILVDVDFWTQTREVATERFNRWVVG